MSERFIQKINKNGSISLSRQIRRESVRYEEKINIKMKMWVQGHKQQQVNRQGKTE